MKKLLAIVATLLLPITGDTALIGSRDTLFGVSSIIGANSGPTGNVILDATATSGNGSSTTGTINITVGSGTNRILVVVITSGSSPASSVLDGAASMTTADTAGGGLGSCSSYYILNPATGAHTINITFGGTTNFDSAAYSLFGVNQTNPIDAHGNNTATNAAPSVVVTAVQSNSFMTDGLSTATNNITDTLPHSGTAFLVNNILKAASGYRSNGSLPAGSFTTSYTLAGSAQWWMSVVAWQAQN